jgi:CBS domain-containing protein
MTRDPITVPDDASADDVVDEYVLRHHCSAFPVVGRDGSLRGLVTLARVRSVPPDRRPATNVASLAWPLSSLTVAAPQEFLLDVLMRLGTDGEGDGRILVLDNGRLVGIVSPSDVSRAVQIAEWGHAA